MAAAEAKSLSSPDHRILPAVVAFRQPLQAKRYGLSLYIWYVQKLPVDYLPDYSAPAVYVAKSPLLCLAYPTLLGIGINGSADNPTQFEHLT